MKQSDVKRLEPRFSYERVKEIESLDYQPVEFYRLDGRAIYVLNRLAQMVQWHTRWTYDGQDDIEDDLLVLQWEIYNQMTTPAHFDELVTVTAEVRDELTGIREALEGIGEVSTSLDGLTGVLALLDPRLALLLQVLDSLETVVGGTYELPPGS